MKATGGSRTALRLAAGIGTLMVVLLGSGAAPAAAHPLGNLSTNSYSGLRVTPSRIDITLVVDAAEVPTLQAFPAVNGAGVDAGTAQQHADGSCSALAGGLDLRLNDQPVALHVASAGTSFLPGAAGLKTSRLACSITTAQDVVTTGRQLTYRDPAVEHRTGWREITARGDGVDLADSTVPVASVSDELRGYPQDLLTSPLDVRDATARVVPGRGSAAPILPVGGLGQRADHLTGAFTDLVGRHDLSVGFAGLALLMAALLGAIHALAPGHGKALMAAYLLGTTGSMRRAAVLGVSVTATHTLGVLCLGLAFTLAPVAPGTVYSWLGLTSGVLLAGVGAQLLLAARRRTQQSRVVTLPSPRTDQPTPVLVGGMNLHPQLRTVSAGLPHLPNRTHPHDHDHDPAAPQRHSHGLYSHTHALPGTRNNSTGWSGVVSVGFLGGLVPSPSAVLVLLAGIALGRAWFGVSLVIAYGIGMTLTLLGIGLLLVKARDRAKRWSSLGSGGGRRIGMFVVKTAPLVTAAVVLAVGLGIAWQAAAKLIA